jgi:hypothetical protein
MKLSYVESTPMKKLGGWGVLLLTRFPTRESVLRSPLRRATKDLPSHPTRMLILSERSESKNLSLLPTNAMPLQVALLQLLSSYLQPLICGIIPRAWCCALQLSAREVYGD